MRIAIINGPNLNLIGIREKEIYGSRTFDDFLAELRQQYPDVEFLYYQSNVEGELINDIQETGFIADGIILNAGAYTHTSLAIADAVAAVKAPVIEVHISNISAREPVRHDSHLTAKCVGIISGLGLDGYRLAVEWLVWKQKQ
ncbi:MAG: 3-dehydroquinate dehydratase [Saprospiraceae bacterium]|nr:3-dehydroquinate dehydratase [Saprospiraceae bacterium]